MDNKNQFENILQNLSKKLNSNPDSLKSAAQNNDVNKLLSNLDPKQANKVKSILSDPEASKKILESPQAQALIKKLNGNKQ